MQNPHKNEVERQAWQRVWDMSVEILSLAAEDDWTGVDRLTAQREALIEEMFIKRQCTTEDLKHVRSLLALKQKQDDLVFEKIGCSQPVPSEAHQNPEVLPLATN